MLDQFKAFWLRVTWLPGKNLKTTHCDRRSQVPQLWILVQIMAVSYKREKPPQRLLTLCFSSTPCLGVWFGFNVDAGWNPHTQIPH